MLSYSGTLSSPAPLSASSGSDAVAVTSPETGLETGADTGCAVTSLPRLPKGFTMTSTRTSTSTAATAANRGARLGLRRLGALRGG